VSLKPASAPPGLESVRSGWPAAKAGLQSGDVITSFGGKKIASVDALRFAVDAKKPGDTVTVTFLRNGKSRTVNVTLAMRPANPN
jgi:putative serine protease PepD